jgi:5-methyltetrahydrofolate--homocysteine methyltransferase
VRDRMRRQGYLDALAARVLVFDGAMGTSVHRYDLGASDFGGERLVGCNDHLVLTRTDVIEEIHASFLDAGCDVIETCTFRANRITMKEYGLDGRIGEMNRAAAQLARRVGDRFASADQPRFVAGSIGPSGMLPSSSDPMLSAVSFGTLVEVFREQAQGLTEGGCDLLIIETSQDILEVKAAIIGCQQAFAASGVRLPLQVQVTLDVTGRMLLGTDIGSALTTVERMGVDVFGLNCSTGPEHMREPVAFLAECCGLPVSCIPNAGLPLNVDGRAVFPLEPGPFADELADFVVRLGVSAVGGCCGTTPEHIRELVVRVGGRAQQPRPSPTRTFVSSGMKAVGLCQQPPPMLIGERLNSQGSKKMKELLLADDYDGMVALGREQVDGGAHTLDVCVALTERADEAAQMCLAVRALSQGVEAPLVIDTTEAEVLRAALEAAPGRVIVNAVNMEAGRTRLDAMLPLVLEHGAAVIALTIDERGMAKTAARKLEVAQAIYEIATGEYGLAPDALIFDALTFTLATGDPEFAASALETLGGIRRIKAELPGVLTSLGVSNISFGFKPAARAVLNSVFLHHAVAAGLDMAIVNARQITPYAEIPELERELAADLLLNRRQDASARFVSHFEGVTLKTAAAVDETAGMSAEQRIRYRIVHRRKDGVEHDVDEIVVRRMQERTGVVDFLGQPEYRFPNADTSEAAASVINEVLLPAMKEVGDRFGAGELILPFVLQSAEVMKLAVGHVERYLERRAGVSKGTIVLATVYGDVHDIGKNLVKTILANNGFTVHDLGKQVPANVIVEKAVDLAADAIGLSALLVSTSKQMPIVVQELHRRGVAVPVLLGGAAINRRFGRRTLFVDAERREAYRPGVFYCKDAFEGLEVVNRLGDPAGRHAFIEQVIEEARADTRSDAAPSAEAPIVKSEVAARPALVPIPAVWGPRVVEAMPLETVFEHLDIKELYRLSWGAKSAHGEQWQRLQAEFDARLERMKRQAVQDGLLAPRGVYGFWPAQSEGNELVVFDPDGHRRELLRFCFPRQKGQDHLCLADYFAPLGGDVMDVVGFQIVTVGGGATARFDDLEQSGEYSEAYYFHGLAVQCAEAAAELLHQHVRRELGVPAGQGKRYSWGYPAIPELADHAKVFQLLPAESKLGMSLSPAYQLIPEQSTAAIVVHHPEARYFSLA